MRHLTQTSEEYGRRANRKKPKVVKLSTHN